MFRKRIGDQSESKIDSDKIPAKKDRARFAGPLRGAFGLLRWEKIVGCDIDCTFEFTFESLIIKFISFISDAATKFQFQFPLSIALA